jgi:hypothetical protein
MRLPSLALAAAACALLVYPSVRSDAEAGVRAVLLSPSPAQSTAPPAACAAPQELVEPDETLPRLASVLHPGGRLNVLALGSGMMLGPNGELEESFPYLMARILEAAVPGLEVRLAVIAAKGLTAEEMLGNLRDELAHGEYGLVLWQTGSVEAVRRLSTDAFRQTLAAGAQAVRDAGGELVLIDPPYGPALRSRAQLDPYLAILHDAEKFDGVVLFPRFALMRHWAQSGEFDPEHAPRAERDDTLDILHACLANALARLVLRAGGHTMP